MSKFLEVFDMCKDALSMYEPVLTSAEVLSLEVDKEKEDLVAQVAFDSLISEKVLKEIERKIHAYLMGKANFSIAPKFKKESLGQKYVPELISILKRQIAVTNGFLENSEWEFAGDTVTVTLTHGGRDILTNSPFISVLQNTIAERFGISVQAILAEKQFDVEEALHSAQEKQDQFDKEHKVEQQLKEKYPEGAKIVKAPKKQEQAESDAPPREHIIKEGIGYYLESVKPLFGSNIRTTPMPIADIQLPDEHDEVPVVVWGRIFCFDSHTSKNGKYEIITFYLTDDTDSCS